MADFVEFLSLNQFVDKKGQPVLIGKLNGLKLLIRKNPFRWGPDYIGSITGSYIDLGGEYRRVAVPRVESLEPITGGTEDASTHQFEKLPHAHSPPSAENESQDERDSESGVTAKSETSDPSL